MPNETVETVWTAAIKRWMLRILFFAGAVMVIGLAVAWYNREPSYDGKTVTEWLDCMHLVDQWRTRSHEIIHYRFSKEMMENDASLKALLAIGSNAAPILVKRIAERPRPEPQSSGYIRYLPSGLKEILWAAGKNDYEASVLDYQKHEARKIAAIFTLAALGTNGNGGFKRVMEAYASSLSFYSAANGQSYAAMDLDTAMNLVHINLPDRLLECTADITAGLNHPNAAYREAAASITWIFYTESTGWKKKLMELTRDSDDRVRCCALRSLMHCGGGWPSDANIALAADLLRDQGNSTRLRCAAAREIARFHRNCSHLLPLLYQVVQEPNTNLQHEVRIAIKDIAGR